MKRTILLLSYLLLMAGITVQAEVTWPLSTSETYTITLGSQVTSAADVEDGAYYVFYNPRNDYYMYENASNNQLKLTGGLRNSTFASTTNTITHVFKLTANGTDSNSGERTYLIQSASGRYMPKPTAEGSIYTAENASDGGSYIMKFSSDQIFPRCVNGGSNGSTVYGLDHTGNTHVHAFTNVNTTAGGAQNYRLFRVTISRNPITSLNFTFDRAGSTVNDVTVNVKDDNGETILGLIPTLEAASVTAFQTTGNAAITRTTNSVLVPAPNSGYSNATGNTITYTFKVVGLPTSVTYNTSTVDLFASTSGGGSQTYNDTRSWGITIQTGSTEAGLSNFTTLSSVDATSYNEFDGGVIHHAWEATGTAKNATAPLWFKVVLTKGNDNGCFAGIGAVKLSDAWTPTASEVYTINNTNANRGALIYNPNGSTKYVWSSGKSGTFNAAEANSQWVIIPTGTDGQYYLYNVGAGKFAIPTNIAQGASYPWIFSDNAVAVIFEAQTDGTKKIKMATNPVSGSNAAYMAVSNNYEGPIINYNDAGGNFTITKVDGQDQSTAANSAVAKLIKKQTALTSYPQATGWYAIQIKSKSGSDSYAERYVYEASTLYSDLYPLTFTGGVDVQPAITDPTFFTHLDCRDWNDNDWQLPDGRYLVANSNNKFPTVSNEASSIIAGYDGGNYFKSSANYFADPYNSGANYYIGETTSFRTTWNIYPIDLTTAGLTPWQVIVEGLDASTLVTCTRSDVRGLTSVYTNGYFFLPTGSTPAQGEFTAEVSGSTITLPVTIDSEAHTITTSMPVLTINSPMAAATFTWNGESQTGKSVSFIYTGGTISDTNITVSYTGNEYTSPTLSQSTWDGTASATVTCALTPAFFSTNYGDKWIRIGNALGGTTVMGLTTATSGEIVKMKTLDYFDDAQLWCFVGDATSFKIYNKKAGETLQMASSSTTITNDVTAVMAAAGADATDWKLQDKWNASNGPGWAIFYGSHDGSKSLNAKGGTTAGNNVGYYNNGDGNGGSRWLITDASGEVTLDLAGLDPSTMTVYTQNIAVLPSTIAGSASETLLTKDNFVTRTAFVPNNTELTFGTPKLFMNYGFTGFDGSNQTKTVTATTTPQTVTATFSVVRPDARYLWEPLRIYNGSGEKDYYRIPAIVTAKNGDVIAINDRRWNNDTDLGNNSGTAANPVNHHIDIIGVASSDNGSTWGSEFMIMDGTGSGTLAGYGDAAVVADRESNKVLVMACAGNVFYTGQNNSYHQTIQRTVLTHNGTTWVAETPTDVTDQFYAGSLTSSDGMFIGSGAISQSKIIKKGDYYRIYCAVLERSSSNFVFYSDDFGLTWTMMGSTAPAKDNEPKVEELLDGSVLLSVRKYYGRTFNIWTWNDDTYTTGSWGTAVASNNQTGGISFGNNSTNGDIRMIPAIKKATGEMVTLAMQSVPTAGSRAEVSLYYKELDPTVTYTPTTIAQNWSSRFLVTPHSSAYSSFNLQPDGRIGFYMEEEPASVTGYYMCYVPLTLDEITNNQYTGLASTYPVTLNTVGAASYATLYLPFDVTTDANTKAYYIGSTTNGYAQLTELTDGEIAANTAVLLVNETANSATFTVTTGLTQQISESANYLKGTLTGLELDLGDGTNYYALGKKNNEIGFYKFQDGSTTSITLGANRAYLDTTAPANPVKGFTFDFSGADGIDEIVNGKSVNGKWFNLSGQRLSKPQKGINIIDGQKVIIK